MTISGVKPAGGGNRVGRLIFLEDVYYMYLLFKHFGAAQLTLAAQPFADWTRAPPHLFPAHMYHRIKEPAWFETFRRRPSLLQPPPRHLACINGTWGQKLWRLTRHGREWSYCAWQKLAAGTAPELPPGTRVCHTSKPYGVATVLDAPSKESRTLRWDNGNETRTTVYPRRAWKKLYECDAAPPALIPSRAGAGASSSFTTPTRHSSADPDPEVQPRGAVKHHTS